MEKYEDLKSTRLKAKKLKKQLEQVMDILNRADYRFAKDNMFIDYMVISKRNLDGALHDYLLDDNYWKEKIKNHILT